MLRSDHSAFLTRLPVFPLQPGLLVAALLAAFAFGCTPKIGDSCTTSTNCSAAGDRLCDITEPGGYCTVFNCEPDSCPADSVCINFGTRLSPVNDCSLANSNSPYQRSFCMASCSSSGDCRGGYDCVDLSGKPRTDANGNPVPANNVGAVLADSGGNGKVCVANTIGSAVDGGAPSGVCNGDPDAGPPPAEAAGSGGSGGSSGAADSGAPGAAGSNEAGAGG
ncbi:MAG: hypothetical protein ABI548_08215 [Polyangiaceae bacterium]